MSHDAASARDEAWLAKRWAVRIVSDRSSMTVPEPPGAKNDADVSEFHHLRLRDLFQSLSDISAVSSMHELLPHVARYIASSVGAQRCSVFLFTPDLTRFIDHLRWGYSHEEYERLKVMDATYKPLENGALRHVAATASVLERIPGETADDLLPSNMYWRERYWAGDIVIPLVWNGVVEGVAFVLVPDGAERFEPLQLDIAQGVGRQVAGIINHLRATEAERAARQQTEMLLDLSRVFNSANSTTDVFDNLAEAVQRTMQLDAVSIVVRESSILTDGGMVNTRVAARGMTDDEIRVRDAVLRKSNSLGSTIDLVASNNNDPVIIEAAEHFVDDEPLRRSFINDGIPDLLVVPLIVAEHLHGMLYGWNRNRNIHAGDDSLRITGIMVRHASASVERLLLVQSERQQRRRIETLAAVHRAFGELDDPVELLHVAMNAVGQALDAAVVTAIVYDTSDVLPAGFVSTVAFPDEIAALLAAVSNDRRQTIDDISCNAQAQVLPHEDLARMFGTFDGQETTVDLGVAPKYGVTIPLFLRQQPLCTLHAWYRDTNATIQPNDLETASEIVRDLGLAIERVALEASERREWNRAEMLLSFADRLNRSVELADVTSAIHRAILAHLPGVNAAVALYGDPDQEWTVEPELPVDLDPQILNEARSRHSPTSLQIDGYTLLIVPLIAGDEEPGALIVARIGTGSLTALDGSTLSSLAPQAADAIQRARLHSVSSRTISELTLLHEVSRTMSQRQHLPDILEYIGVEVKRLLDYSVGVLALDCPDPDYLENVSIWGDMPADALGNRLPLQSSILGTVYQSQTPLLIDDINEHPSAWGKDRADWQSVVCVPLMSGTQAIGAMLVGHQEQGKFTPDDLRLASLVAGQAGAAIYQARESERQRQLYRAGVEALAAAVDAKDSYIHSHSRHVAELSRRTAEVLELDAEEVERIELASLLHDVGKIGIPDNILTKPGRLDSQERLVMIGHATLGARIVAAHPALAHMSDLILHHHEWHNGAGYPDGLRGDEVPIGAAIIAVSDAYDSMTTYRPYRDALTFDAACEELLKWKGTQFHPRVVEAFLAWISSDGTAAHTGPGQTLAIEPIRSVDIVAPRVLSSVAEEIGRLTDMYPFLDRLQQIIRSELKYEEVNIFLNDEPAEQLILGASTTNSSLVGRLRIAVGDGIAGQAAQARATLNHKDVLDDARAGFIDLGMRSVLAVPLLVDDHLVGVLGAGSTEPQRFEERDEAQLEAIARQIAPTVMVSRLHDLTRMAASIDGLTGVMNHRAFYLRLESMIADLDTWDNELHLLIVDVIGLKAINDVHGHLAGDRALVAIANALKNRVRAEDEVARYGGDEFVVIVRGTPRGGLDELVERVIAPVEFRIDSGHDMSVRLRCGVATAVSSSDRATELVARADAGLYAQVRPTERNDQFS